MVTFVNRQTETTLINDAFKALQNYTNDNHLRNSIIGFYGVEGIGKTAVLAYIEEQCKKQQIRYIHINAGQSANHFSYEIVRQATERYNIRLPSLDNHANPFQQSLHAIKALMEQGTAVMIVDNVDATHEELLERIADTLRDTINEKKLFVVFGSKRDLAANFERAISRQLITFQLKPLDPTSCEHYLDIIDPSLTPATRKYILDWACGYPLAMQIMTTTIIEDKLDPAKPADQKVLIDRIVERVIDQKVLAKLTPAKRQRYKEALTILSIPRRFNLTIMQELIERFAPNPDLKRETSLAYMNLPKSIKNDTDVLSWNISKGGYVVDMPIRNLFLLQARLEQTERYFEIHSVLAKLNKKLADEATASDPIGYLCEYLYHSAYVKSEQEFSQLLEQTLLESTKTPFESFEVYKTSFEELVQDNEFREALGEQLPAIQSLIYKHLAEMDRREAHKTLGG